MVKCYIQKNPDLGSLVLRLTLGLLFVYGGVGKLFLGGATGLSGLLWGQLWLAYLVGIVELLAGIGLIIGFMARHSALLLIIVMIFAIFLAHNPFVNSSELMNALIRLALIGGLAQVLFSGAGKMCSAEKENK